MTGILTALVLAGTRAGGDPLAAQAGVAHKALIDIGGRTMLDRVVAALAASPLVERIAISTDSADLVSQLPQRSKPVVTIPAAGGPSASAAAALESYGTPLLVTTSDHPLLTPQWIGEFFADAPAGADAVIAVARRETVTAATAAAALPETRRTYLQFSDGDYSGCNLFLLATAGAARAVRLWAELEALRKRPLALVQRLGVAHALRYQSGRLSLPQALTRLGELSGASLGAVALSDGLAAIDVDKPEDLETVRRLIEARER